MFEEVLLCTTEVHFLLQSLGTKEYGTEVQSF